MKPRICDMREDRDLAQACVSSRLQCDQSLYSKYERATRDVPLHIVVKLALFYDMSVDYLVGLTDEARLYSRTR